ncbi:MAG: hypothetical protein U0354_19685 [Candidatus Sericytochromatia bacterium]
MNKLLFFYNKLLRQIPYIPRTIKLIYEATGNITSFWFILLLIQGILPLFFIYLIKDFIDTISINKFELESIYT